MKQSLIILLLVALSGCSNENEGAAIKWVNDHKKPIRCTFIKHDTFYDRNIWLLMDPDGNCYYTNRVDMTFPDTIKVYKDTISIRKVIIDIQTHAYPNRGWVKCGTDTWYSMDTTGVHCDTQN